MDKLLKKSKTFFYSTCTPTKVYLIFSLISILMILFQNINDSRKYCLGMFKCKLNFSNILLFILKLVYTIVWVVILDSLCVNKYENIAWGIVMFPLILMFVLLGVFIVSKKM